MQVDDYGSLPPGRGLALEMDALHCLEASAPRPVPDARGRGSAAASASRSSDPGAAGDTGERLILWDASEPAVVLPVRGDPDAWANAAACAARGVPLLRRESGGGAVVVGPGCLNVALVLSLERRPWLHDVERSYEWLLRRLSGALSGGALAGGAIAVHSTDLAIGGRKFAGHAQRRVRGALLHHGVVLHDFPLHLIDALLPEPPRRPAWRGNRTHREFLTNAPLAREEIVRRLRRLPAGLEP